MRVPAASWSPYRERMRAFSFGIILLVAIIAAVGGGVAFTRRKSSTGH